MSRNLFISVLPIVDEDKDPRCEDWKTTEKPENRKKRDSFYRYGFFGQLVSDNHAEDSFALGNESHNLVVRRRLHLLADILSMDVSLSRRSYLALCLWLDSRLLRQLSPPRPSVDIVLVRNTCELHWVRSRPKDVEHRQHNNKNPKSRSLR